MSLLIKGGKAFIDGEFVEKDILIENETIGQIGSGLKGDETIDAKGLLVLPGLIDPHVHFREPGQTNKEDFRTGSRAAIAGGFTTVFDMPNNSIPTINKERYEEKIRLAKKKAICDVLFHFGGTDDNFDEVKEADPPSMKIYLGKTTGELMLNNPDSLEKHFMNFPKDRPIVLHCGSHAEDPAANLKETYEITERAISLAKKTDHAVHLAHASSKKEIDIAKQYEKCTVEVTPHHLFLSEDDAVKLGLFAKVYPMLRPEEERQALLAALQRADCIASDHAPHTVEDKENGAAGFPGLETCLGLMLTRGNLPLERLFTIMSENPAKIFNLNIKGKLKEGYLGDVTLVDPKKEWKVEAENMESKSRWSPYEGMLLKGRVCTVIKNGKPVYQDYQFI